MNSSDSGLINRLVAKTLEKIDDSTSDIEKLCWIVVHESHHGVKPFEYDIREIDEALYLSVLKIIKEKLNK